MAKKYDAQTLILGLCPKPRGLSLGLPKKEYNLFCIALLASSGCSSALPYPSQVTNNIILGLQNMSILLLETFSLIISEIFINITGTFSLIITYRKVDIFTNYSDIFQY